MQINLSQLEMKTVNLIIGLTKQIYVKKPPENIQIWISSQFFPGNGTNKPRHIGIEWWITKKGEKYLNSLISIFKKNCNGYIKRDSIQNIVIGFFENNLFNNDFFSADSIFLSKRKTIFESIIYESPIYFGYQVYKKIVSNLNQVSQPILFLYPLHRIKFDNFIIENEGIEIVSTHLKNFTFEKLTNTFPQLQHFNAENGTIYGDKSNFSNEYKVEGWLLLKVIGEKDSCTDIVKLSIKMFFAILFSILAINDISKSYSSMAKSETGILRLTKKDSTFLEIGNVVHPFPGKIDIQPGIITEIQNIYSKINAFEIEKRKRYEIAANYLINSFCSNDIEKYINLFIVLDALWGVDRKSKSSIVEGIKMVIGKSSVNNEKANKLYDLRCEIIHGSCLLLDDWKYYDKFYSKYNSDPIRELSTIAIRAIKNVIL